MRRWRRDRRAHGPCCPGALFGCDHIRGAEGIAHRTRVRSCNGRGAPTKGRWAGLHPLRGRRDDRLGRAARIGAAGALEAADRADGHVVVAEHLTRQPDAAQPFGREHLFLGNASSLDGSPATNSTRHVVHRAFPPHACMMSTFASCSIASTSRLSAGTSNVPYPSTVNLDMPVFCHTKPVARSSGPLSVAPAPSARSHSSPLRNPAPPFV